MYSYKYDTETGGLLLIDTLSQFSKEPRPVYSRELDLLGFDKIWKYEKTDEAPYLWAEAQFYFYRGKRVAKTIGGSLYERPNIELETDETGNEILPEGSILQPVDVAAMVEKNHNLIEILECEAVKKIYDVYKRYSEKLDCFHVAFSGGKDSIVLLELVKRALPANSFIVVFGDTGMEFPDTYETVNVVEAQCKADGVAFYRASSHFKPEESWRLFGPPSRVLRWCCSVHKSVPQTLKLREILGKNDYSGMAFVGVRWEESEKRSKYKFLEFNKKQIGQASCNAIVNWTSAEIWLYIYSKNLTINNAYKKGSARVGCLCCPLGSGWGDFVQKENYACEIKKYVDIVIAMNSRNEFCAKDYMTKGGWNARKNGAFLRGNKRIYSESVSDSSFKIKISDTKTDWKEWLGTLGDVIAIRDGYILKYGIKDIPFSLTQNANEITVSLENSFIKNDAEFGRLFRTVFRRTAYCMSCGTCQANCKHGAISFARNHLRIDGCVRCHECFNVSAGCLVYDSLKIPVGNGGKMGISMAVNCYSNHAPKTEWLKNYFEKQQEYFTSNNGLGPVQQTKFKRFLKDCGLLDKSAKCTSLNSIINSLGWDTESSLAVLLVNLAYTGQFGWYIKNMSVNEVYLKEEIIEKLKQIGQSDDNISSIIASYKRIVELPFGTKLHWGQYVKAKAGDTLSRTKAVIPADDVILYALYKFAEACDGYYEFTLSRLMDFTVDSAGVSPAEIFGLSREEMEQFLNSLSRSRPEFVSYTATHDLEVIRLADDKKASDVLSLFQGVRK